MKRMIVDLDGLKLNVEIIIKNNKNVYMRFKDANTLVVTCHRLVSKRKIESIILENKEKLLKMFKAAETETQNELYFWYLGKKYIPIFQENIKKVQFDGENIYAQDQKMLERFKKKETIRIFQMELDRIVPHFENIPKFDLKIRKMKTRWGVCNRGNNTITLNSELLKKDLDLLDYVIIHELCHFYEANHSERFWSWVSKYYPKYKEARKRLRG